MTNSRNQQSVKVEPMYILTGEKWQRIQDRGDVEAGAKNASDIYDLSTRFDLEGSGQFLISSAYVGCILLELV